MAQTVSSDGEVDVAAVGLTELRVPECPNIDIVFVHGFTGNAKRTWTHQGKRQSLDGERPFKIPKLRHRASTVYWPLDLLPSTAPNARILTFGYDTNYRHWSGPPLNRSGVYDIARDFLVCLDAKRRDDLERPLIFIAHSLGGIVVKEALRQSHGYETDQRHLYKIFEKTIGIIFFGTPHGGADPKSLLRSVAERLAKAMGFSVNEQIVSTLLPSSERLRELRESFGPVARRRKWMIHSFQEELGMAALQGGKIVEDISSRLDDPEVEISQHIYGNHQDMCQFASVDDHEYQKVAAAIERLIAKIPVYPPETPQDRSDTNKEIPNIQTLIEDLKFEEMGSRHTDIKKEHSQTCRWLITDSMEFKEWCDPTRLAEHNGLLWIKGHPGTGKSTLMKFALEHAKEYLKDDTLIHFFFHARGNQIEKSVEGMYRTLLVQILEKIPQIADKLLSSCLKPPMSSMETFGNVDALQDLFEVAVRSLGDCRLTCFVDALDECNEEDIRQMVRFFERLGENAIVSSTSFRVCFSSRHYPTVSVEKSIGITLEKQNGHHNDIARYLRSELKGGKSKAMQTIKDEIAKRSSGIFLWVALVVSILNKDYDRGNIHKLRRRLKEIPDNLHELFEQIVTRDCECLDELKLCVRWMLFAERPLEPRELYWAILTDTHFNAAQDSRESFKPESPGSDMENSVLTRDDASTEDIDRFILNSSKGLAETARGKKKVVQFIHESVREFFLKEGGRGLLFSGSHDDFWGQSHQILKNCCYTYFLRCYRILDASSAKHDRDEIWSVPRREKLVEEARDMPFLRYSTVFVLHHANEAEGLGVSQASFMKAFPLVRWLNLHNMVEKFQTRRYGPETTMLYVLAAKGLAKLVQYEPKFKKCDQPKGRKVGTPLHAAVAISDHFTIKCLLEKGKIDVDATEGSGTTALLCAVSDIETMAILLKHGANINATDSKGATALVRAVNAGSIRAIELLLRSGASANECNAMEESALTLATEQRNSLELVELLLRNGANVNATCRSGSTALIRAAAKNQTETIKVLQRNGANIHAATRGGDTALSMAAIQGRPDAIELLLDFGADIDATNSEGESALMLAATHADVNTCEVLLRHGADPYLVSRYGSNALDLSIIRRNDNVAKMLAGKGVHFGCKTLPIVLSRRTRQSMSVLLKGAPTDCTIRDWEDSLLAVRPKCDDDLLHLIQEKTKFGALVNQRLLLGEFLLRRGPIFDDVEKSLLSSVLYHAVKWGSYEFLQMLVAGGADVNVKIEGGFPLTRASFWGLEKKMLLLLESGASIDDLSLVRASENGGLEVVKILIEWNALKVTEWNRLEQALIRSIEKGHKDVFLCLLEKIGSEQLKKLSGTTRRTLTRDIMTMRYMDCLAGLYFYAKIRLDDDNLHWHAYYLIFMDYENLTLSLLKHYQGSDQNRGMLGDVLLLAARMNQMDAAEMLVRRGACLDVQDRSGWTPLMHATSSGNYDLAVNLVEAGSDLHIATPRGTRALDLAKKYGMLNLVQYFEQHESR